MFVDELFQDACHYSTLTIYNTAVLHPSAVIDQTYETRKLMAVAVAAQFFGCFISTEKWSDRCVSGFSFNIFLNIYLFFLLRWIKTGIPMYLMGLWVKKTFGNNEYRDLIHRYRVIY